MDSILLKQCSRKEKCEHIGQQGWLPATREYFSSYPRNTSGLQSRCKKCCAEHEHIKLLNNPDHIHKLRRQRRADNPGKARAADRIDRARNREHRLEYSREYDKTHRHIHRIIDLRRRARQLELADDFSRADWQKSQEYFEFRCAVCGRGEDFWTVLAADHWIPLSKHGGTVPENIIPLCHARKGVPAGEPCCNNSKKDKDPLIWLTERYGKHKAKQINKRIQDYFEWVRQQDEH